MYTTFGRALEFVAWIGIFWFAIGWVMTRRTVHGIMTILSLLGILWRHIHWLSYVHNAGVAYLIPQNAQGMTVFVVLILLPWVLFVIDERRTHEVFKGWREYLGSSDAAKKRK